MVMNMAKQVSNDLLPASVPAAAVRKWGKVKQLHATIEECSELIKCIVKYMRYDWNRVWELKTLDEVVDVDIQLREMRLILGVSDEEYEKLISQKMERLAKIIHDDNPYRGLKGEDVGRVIRKQV